MEPLKRYDPQEAEIRIMEKWEKDHTFKFDSENVEKTIFSIDTPPPTVSGKMHMGHAFGNSQQDFIARYKRMKGFNVLQPFGTDDNGLPTKLLIEKMKKISSSKMERKEFIKIVLKTLKEDLRPEYVQDWKRLGVSCDFNISYTTMDNHSQKISQQSFIDLYNLGRQYRKEAPAMFCPKCVTAISQVELEDKEVDSSFNKIIFKVDGEDIIVATTRPELLPGCVALFYHPSDKRYTHLKGKTAKVPLFDVEVPILEDNRPDPEKGTGIVMCCTFGDSTDMEWQRAYSLPIIEVINQYGKLTDVAGDYMGLKVIDARKKIIEDLESKKLLVEKKPIKHTINVHERCGTPIEYIHSKQWFVKYLDKKEEMLSWGNEFKWFPEHMKNRYDNWVKGLQWDWLISRQLPFGIPFPVWYCEDCGKEKIAESSQLPVDPLTTEPLTPCVCGSNKFIPEKDVMNTWATSSLTPTIVKELFKNKPVYKLLNGPMDLRPQGHDIISFWLFNTVAKSKLQFNVIPWKNAFINGWMLDPHGKKMAKSKGNIVSPQDMIKKYSADSLRFMSSGCKLGDDFPFQEKDLVAGMKTTNKLWNASRFSLSFLTEIKKGEKRVIDEWALSKLHKLIKNSTNWMDDFNFSRARLEIDKFFWKITDNYLELIKDRLYNSNDFTNGAKETLNEVLYSILKLFAPFLPFITEEIYSLNHKESIHLTSWPKYDFNKVNDRSEIIGDVLISIIEKIRKSKSEKKVSMKTEVKKVFISADLSEDEFEKIRYEIETTMNVKEIIFKSGLLEVKSEI